MRTNQPNRLLNLSGRIALVNVACLILLCCSSAVFGQWTTNGNDISNSNTGNVGVGTTTPAYKLDLMSAVSAVARFNTSAAGATHVLIDAGSAYNSNLTLQRAGVSKWYLGNRAANDRFTAVVERM